MNTESSSTDRDVVSCRFRKALGTTAAMLTAAGIFLPAQAAAATSFEYLMPVSNGELASLRGGFVLPNGMVVNVWLEFHTTVSRANGNGIPFIEQSWTFDEEDLERNGVVYTVTVEPPQPVAVEPPQPATVEPANAAPVVLIEPKFTDNISGVMNVIQNNANEIAIRNTTTLNVDMMNAAIAQRMFQAHSFTLRMRTAGALSLGF